MRLPTFQVLDLRFWGFRGCGAWGGVPKHKAERVANAPLHLVLQRAAQA